MRLSATRVTLYRLGASTIMRVLLLGQCVARERATNRAAEQDAAGMSAITLRSQQKRGSLQKCYLMRLAPSKICPHGMMQPTACLTQAKRSILRFAWR